MVEKPLHSNRSLASGLVADSHNARINRPSLLEAISSNVADYAVKASFHLSATSQSCFIKTNYPEELPALEAEMAALDEIAGTNTVQAPLPICAGIASGRSFLALEWVTLYPLDDVSSSRFGRALAALHSHTAPAFGWHRDNTIGATRQTNTWTRDWITFWREHRLGAQLRLAAHNGFTGSLQDLGARLLERSPALFSGYSPEPSLLHGDLWHGNAACMASGEPVVFDPASYYGDREVDLAMTSLFGGFCESFFAAYHAAWPVDQGYGLRRDFYNIYHLLNHLNLFGKCYLARTEAMMQSVLADLAG